MKKLILLMAAGIAAGGAGWGTAQAASIQIDLATQTMHVHSREGDFDWPISSARSGYVTPRGTYGVQRLEAMHFSRKYHNSPMPHSIFFRGGYAIHGSYETSWLGTPASHGCVRLAPENAAILYQIVREEGARIAISGSPGSGEPRYVRAERRRSRGGDFVYGADGQPLYGTYSAPASAPGLGNWLSAPALWGQDDQNDE